MKTRAGKEECSRALSHLKELHSVNSIIDIVRSLSKYCYRNEHIDTRNTWYKSQTVKHNFNENFACNFDTVSELTSSSRTNSMEHK